MKKIIYAAMLLLGLSILSSCKNGSNSGSAKMPEGYEWLEGTWKYESDYWTQVVRITPEYYQSVRDDYDETLNIDASEKIGYEIKILHNKFIGDEKALVTNIGTDNEWAEFYIDEGKKGLYFLYDFDIKEYFIKQ